MVWETELAIGDRRAVLVFNVGHFQTPAVGYAVYAQDPNQPGNPWGWAEAIIPLDPNDPNDPNAPVFAETIDPSVIYDPFTGDFYATGITTTATPIEARLPAGVLQFDAWHLLDPNRPTTGDKPFVTPGETVDQGGGVVTQELYWIILHANGHEYRRSVDGGDTWIGGQVVRDGDPNAIVLGEFCAQPVAARGRRPVGEADGAPLYLAYTSYNDDNYEPNDPEPQVPEDCEGAVIDFLEGRDQDEADPNDPNEVHYGGMLFTQINDSNPPSPNDPNLHVELNCGSMKHFFPHRTGALWEFKMNKVTPQIAYDAGAPEDPNDDRLYVVHHDLRRDSQGILTTDLDVFLWTLDRKSGNTWELSQRVTINQDRFDAMDPNDPNVPTDPNDPAWPDHDQFLANVELDTAGRVHVTFYDDRAYSQEDGKPDPNDPNATEARFDFFYAVSLDGGNRWFEKKLVWTGDPNEPTVDLRYPLNQADPNDPNYLGALYYLGEYTSITVTNDCWGSQVWAAFTGTWSGDVDPNNDKSVIWYSRLSYSFDLDASGEIDLADLATFLGGYPCLDCNQPCYDPVLDFDADCDVDLSDFADLVAHYGLACDPVIVGGGGVESMMSGGGAPDGPSFGPAETEVWIQPIDTGGELRDAFRGERDHFVFDVNVYSEDPNNDWTTTGIALDAHNGAAFRLADEPNDVSQYATCVSTPRESFDQPQLGLAGPVVAGGFYPVGVGAVFETDSINLCWLDGGQSDPGPASVMRIVLDVSDVQGADVSGGFGSVYYSETGPARANDILIATVQSATATRQDGAMPLTLSGEWCVRGQ